MAGQNEGSDFMIPEEAKAGEAAKGALKVVDVVLVDFVVLAMVALKVVDVVLVDCLVVATVGAR